MPNLLATPSWAEVPELGIDTPALGGPSGPMNSQALALLARSEWLRQVMDWRAPIVALQEYVDDDPTGATDMAPKLNYAFQRASADRRLLYVGPGMRPLYSQLDMLPFLGLVSDPAAIYEARFNSVGSGGILGMSAARWASTPADPLHNVYISGGEWRRAGSLSPDGKVWTGNTGNVLSFWGEHVWIERLRVTGYNRGRVALWGGRHVWLDRIEGWNRNNILGLPCPGIGGTGAFRAFSGGPLWGTRLLTACGDDALQGVPGAVDTIGVDLTDLTYDNCWVRSVKARACVAALVIPDAQGEDIQNSQTMAIRSVTFRNIRGEAKIGCAFYNTDSTGTLGTVLYDDVRIKIIRDLDGEAAPYAVEFLASDLTAGVGPLMFREVEMLNLIEGGIRARGTEIGNAIFEHYRAPAPENAASVYFPVHIQDARHVEFDRCVIAGHPAAAKAVIYMGRNDGASLVERARVSRSDITGIGDGQYGIYSPPIGCARLDVDHTLFVPAPGATDARAIRFSEATQAGLIEANDVSRLGATSWVGHGAGIRFRDNDLPASAATTNGVVHQQLAAADTLAWNGRSALIRLTATEPVTINTITVPAGRPVTATPIIALRAVNNHALTLGSAGNIRAAGQTTFAADQAVLLAYDYVSQTWTQIGQHAEAAPGGDINSQSAAGGTLTWTEGLEMIRVNVAGTVTAISGTPSRAVRLTVMAATAGVIIENNTAIRLSPAANLTLAQLDAVQLQYDRLAGYWVQIGAARE